ncbi:unnamed protein product [Schistosoma turkestanicum]|nr:unnamed protein product [Schistosoma turkestanicum]
MIVPSVTMCSFQSESCSSSDSKLYFGEVSGISNQDLNYRHVDTQRTKAYDGLQLNKSMNSSIRTANSLSQSRLESCDTANDDASSKQLVSSICMSPDSTNLYTSSSYCRTSEQLSHETSLRSIEKSSTDCSESGEHSFISEYQKEKLIPNGAGRAYLHMDRKSGSHINQNEAKDFSSILTDSLLNIDTLPESIKSAPQLSSYLNEDPIQRFHARHYDKLNQYMVFVHNYLPIPIAITVEKCQGSKVTAYILSKYSNMHMRNALTLTAKSMKCNSNKDRSKPLQKTCSNLILHFACQKHYSQCLYPGSLHNRCFSVKTKHYVFWMQLLVLEVQFHHAKPVHITHPSMCLLRNLWSELISDNLHNLSCNESDINPLKTYGFRRCSRNNSGTSGSASVFGYPIRQPEVLTNKELRTESKIRARNSFKIRSRKKQKCQSSFFFLATHSYPTIEHLDSLLKELKETGYFALFQMQETKMSKGYSSRVEWDCFVCASGNGVWKDHCAESSGIIGINGRSQDISAQKNVFNLYYELNPLNPRLTGTLKIKHIKIIPRALAWITSWQVQEFKLENGFIAWKNYLEAKHKISWPTLPNFRDSREKSNTQSFYKNVSSIKTRTGKDWFYLAVDKIVNVKGNYQTGTSYLDHLEIETSDHGTWLVKPHLNGYCDALHRSSTVNPTKDHLISDYLNLWLRGLQIAMVRFKDEIL